MALQNRVTPDGEIIAVGARGTLMGNRGGCFHTDERVLEGRQWVSKQWICCVLDFRGRHRRVMSPRRYTELFFLDEATALAAGHRPCFECRRADALRFAELWLAAHGGEGSSGRATAGAMDAALHRQRISGNGTGRVVAAATEHLPDGVMIRIAGDARAMLIEGDRLLPWSPAGYGSGVARPRGQIPSFGQVLTPFPTIAVIARGYRPAVHPSAFSA